MVIVRVISQLKIKLNKKKIWILLLFIVMKLLMNKKNLFINISYIFIKKILISNKYILYWFLYASNHGYWCYKVLYQINK